MKSHDAASSTPGGPAREQWFIQPDGSVPAWLRFNEAGTPIIDPDRYAALRLMVVTAPLKSSDGVAAEIERILKSTPALPLLAGVLFWAQSLARAVFGDETVEKLEFLALETSLLEDEERG